MRTGGQRGGIKSKRKCGDTGEDRRRDRVQARAARTSALASRAGSPKGGPPQRGPGNEIAGRQAGAVWAAAPAPALGSGAGVRTGSRGWAVVRAGGWAVKGIRGGLARATAGRKSVCGVGPWAALLGRCVCVCVGGGQLREGCLLLYSCPVARYSPISCTLQASLVNKRPGQGAPAAASSGWGKNSPSGACYCQVGGACCCQFRVGQGKSVKCPAGLLETWGAWDELMNRRRDRMNAPQA